jgi:DNA-binding winged helix-turn-helix (wHTH) protein
MRKSPEVVSKKQLLQAVWGNEQPDSDSLKVHLFKLRQQVDTINESKLIHTVAGQGFVFRA